MATKVIKIWSKRDFKYKEKHKFEKIKNKPLWIFYYIYKDELYQFSFISDRYWPSARPYFKKREKYENLTESRNLVQALIRLNLSFTLINTFA